MATTSMDYETANGDRYDEETPRYERDNRSASPRPLRDEADGGRRRSASPSGNGDRTMKDNDTASKGGDDDGAINPGSNLFVTGIHPRLSESEVTRLFEKYGEVEKCQIMRDPHTKESRGFGFVKMVTSDQADAAKEGLQGEQIDGRTLSIEKARRARPRTPTPGKYFGPPKREGGGGGRGGRMNDRYDDRYREDRGYDRTYRDDRGGSYDRRERDDGYSGGGRVDRYGSGGGRDGGGREGGGREGGDRYRDDRRGPGYDRERGYDRGAERDAPRTRDAPAAAAAYGDSAGGRSEAREPYGGGSDYY
ncbi:Transport protein particle 22 kDa subunit [Verticillium dahliae VDG1]|nr:Transport protein particle 22 kDa subunit [Verticillium dahliae VDG1]